MWARSKRWWAVAAVVASSVVLVSFDAAPIGAYVSPSGSEADGDRERARRRSEARGVTAGAPSFEHVERGGRGAAGASQFLMHLTIGNHSASPVRIVGIELCWSDEAERCGVEAGSMPVSAGDTWTDNRADVIPPARQRRLQLQSVYRADSMGPSVLAGYRVQFVDAYGDDWVASFGRGHGSDGSIRRISNRSGFWDTPEDPDLPSRAGR